MLLSQAVVTAWMVGQIRSLLLELPSPLPAEAKGQHVS